MALLGRRQPLSRRWPEATGGRVVGRTARRRLRGHTQWPRRIVYGPRFRRKVRVQRYHAARGAPRHPAGGSPGIVWLTPLQVLEW